ncbi:MAG: IS630 family transposase [Saccharospirillaceae bacterium]|nr:IS630 family transposase [Pseudomonadales bacterium]NRB82064.1 IS630 family transposase [Saccharospirillaceae bacterium]
MISLMKEVRLTPNQKIDLEALHDASRDKRVCDRIKAVLLRSEGWSTSMIAQALRLHETSITRHIDDYVSKNKLAPENGGSQPYLNETQTDEVVSHLMQHTYRCSYEIIEYIFKTYQIRFSISGLNKWLHQHNFSYKYPKGVPHKFDEEKQANFIEKYTELKAQTVDEPILFMDAMHPTQATKVSCGWIKTGHDKSIETTGSRTRLNLVGAIDLNDLAAAQVKRYEKVNGETIQHFFTELRAHHGSDKRIHLILDGAGYHRAQVVKDKANELNIELHYLPPYSPNLNPIERLWKIMNEHVRNNKYFATAKEFRDRIDEFFSQTLPKIGDILGSRINDNFQVLNSAS